MTDAELLKRARVFDAGPPPTVNHYVLDEDDDSQGHYLTVERRGTGWAICYGARWCLDKATGGFEYEPPPSERSADLVARTRFPDVQAAFDFLEAWKPKQREKALRHPEMIRWKDQLAIWAREREAKS